MTSLLFTPAHTTQHFKKPYESSARARLEVPTLPLCWSKSEKIAERVNTMISRNNTIWEKGVDEDAVLEWALDKDSTNQEVDRIGSC